MSDFSSRGTSSLCGHHTVADRARRLFDAPGFFNIHLVRLLVGFPSTTRLILVGGYSHRMPGIAGKTPLAQQSKDYTLATFTKENGNPMLEKSGTTEPRESVCFMVLLVGTSTILFCLTMLPARTITVRKDPALPGLFFSFRSASGLRWKGPCGVAGRPAPDGPPALASREGPEGVATGDERRGNG